MNNRKSSGNFFKLFGKASVPGPAVFLATLSILLWSGGAQAEWINRYSEPSGTYFPTSTQQTSDQGYVVAGKISAGNGFTTNTGWVLKLNSNSTIDWQKSYAGTTSGGIPLLGFNAIQPTSDSGYVMTGGSYASVLKINFDGTVAWWRHYGPPPSGGDGSQYTIKALTSIQQTSDGGYVAAGGVRFYDGSQIGLAVIKLTSGGAVQWARILGPGSESDNPFVRQTADGGYIVAGTKPLPITQSGPGRTDVYAAKLNPDGTFAWSKFYSAYSYTFEADPGVCSAGVNSVEQTSDGGYFLAGKTNCGITSGGPTTQAALALKIKADGAIDWQMAYGGEARLLESLSARPTADGGYIMAGYKDIYPAQGGAWLMKLATDGSIAWERMYKGDYIYGPDAIISLPQSMTEGYIAGAHGISADGSSSSAKLLSLDANGNAAGCSGGGGTDVAWPVNLSAFDPGVNNTAGFSNFPQSTVVDSAPVTTGDVTFTNETLCGVLPSQLDITKTANPSPAIVGQNLTYTIKVKNTGLDTAQAVTVSDPLPSAVTFASADSTQGDCSQANGLVTCHVGALAKGAVATVTIVVTPTAQGNISNTAFANGANRDPVQGSTTTTVTAPGTVGNISTRLRVGTGDNVLIGGFIITGAEPKKVIIRGIGPSLNGVGVTLADPILELHQGGATLATNDNWKTNDQTGQSQQTEIEATTIPPKNDLESAILATLSHGTYTAILVGKNGGTGVGLIEVYDLAQGANSKLANISTRGLVGTDDNVMIAGFIIGGNGQPEGKVVIRAIGPSLAAFGIANVLQDPLLELHNGNGATIQANDDWQQTQAGEINQTGLAPNDTRESAIVTTLPDGNYTAIVRGKNNATGVAVVEVYSLL
jgi:uncharacterized repeat protein (TIGR01451 family)